MATPTRTPRRSWDRSRASPATRRPSARRWSAKDNAGARRAAASLDADAASVDAGLKAHKAAISADRWDALKHQLAAIEKSVPPAPASAASASGAPAPVAPVASGEPGGAGAPASGDAALPPAAADSAAAASAPAPPDNGGPTIKIESRSVVGSVTHLKGYFEGSALRSAGIYEGAQNVKPLKVDHVVGRQKVDFQLSIRDADIATNLRVIDQAGRSATASVFGEDSTALASTGRESGVEVDRGAGSTSGNNTAEIPSESAPDAADAGSSGLDESAPSADEGGIGSGSIGGLGGGSIGGLGGGLGAPMGNIQINIESINPVNPALASLPGRRTDNRQGRAPRGNLCRRAAGQTITGQPWQSQQLLDDLQAERRHGDDSRLRRRQPVRRVVDRDAAGGSVGAADRGRALWDESI